MKYIIMCGGEYSEWEAPRHFSEINGERLVERTIRLLREAGVEDIAISSNNPAFNQFGVPVLEHQNSYRADGHYKLTGHWCDAFYPTADPACYIFGDVVFSPEAIRTIVETETDDIEFFASAYPFAQDYIKRWGEPFALKCVNQEHLRQAIEATKRLDKQGKWKRKPIMWELWQVIKLTPINKIVRNYTVINDYTCDVDDPEDAEKLSEIIRRKES